MNKVEFFTKDWARTAGIDKLVGIAGRAGSGKSTAATYAAERFPFLRYSFAEPLKAAVKQLFMLTDEDVTNPALKEVRHDFWGLSPRRIMQLFGTEAMREVFGENFWVDQAELRLAMKARSAVMSKACIIIDDVRYPNERDWVLKNGGYMIYLVRHNAPAVESHSSESLEFPPVLSKQEYAIYSYQDDLQHFRRSLHSVLNSIMNYSSF